MERAKGAILAGFKKAPFRSGHTLEGDSKGQKKVNRVKRKSEYRDAEGTSLHFASLKSAGLKRTCEWPYEKTAPIPVVRSPHRNPSP